MRFRDFVATIIISTCTSLLVVWALINAGIIQTQQQIPQQQQPIKQTHTGTLTGTLNQTSGEYEAYITKIPIQNVTNGISMRTLHISLAANVTNYDLNGWINIESFQLKDQTAGIIIDEKTFKFKPSSHTVLSIDTSVSPFNGYYLRLFVTGDYNFTLTYDLIVVQEIFV